MLSSRLCSGHVTDITQFHQRQPFPASLHNATCVLWLWDVLLNVEREKKETSCLYMNRPPRPIHGLPSILSYEMLALSLLKAITLWMVGDVSHVKAICSPPFVQRLSFCVLDEAFVMMHNSHQRLSILNASMICAKRHTQIFMDACWAWSLGKDVWAVRMSNIHMHLLVLSQ